MERLTKWRPKRKYREMTEEENARKRGKYGVIAVGTNIPCLIKSFRSLRLPKSIIQALKEKGIRKPSSLQMQGFPTILSGRDTLLVSISREGKTLIFLLPLIIGSLEEELRLPLASKEGPIGLIIVPSRELAYQIYSFAKRFASLLQPRLSICLCTGGVDMQAQLKSLNEGVHIVISTPGRLSDMLGKGKLNLKLCKVLIMDEADRLLDLGFDEEVRIVLAHTSATIQIILASSSIPKRMQEFATNFMKTPIYIASTRLSLKKLKIQHFCDLVSSENKLIKLLEIMQRTDPPVLIFCENKSDSDMIESYLNTKKIECTSLHGGKLQILRSKAIKDFISGNVSVLVATDMAAKGLSFERVQHVINYDMPKDIDNYIQRICRATKKAVVSNFLSYKTDRLFLEDLCDFFIDMGQEISDFLLELSRNEVGKCDYCSIKGHRRSACSLLLMDSLKSELPLII
jgi:ATP-dependent RNA helicase DDX41